MCDSVSGWIHRKRMEILLAHPTSHSQSAEWLGIDVREFNEFEWLHGKDAPIVRVHEDPLAERRLTNSILAQFHSRDLLLTAAKENAIKHKIAFLTSAEEIAAYAGDPEWQVVIDAVGEVNLAAIKQCLAIEANYATSLSLPALAKSGDIYASAATSLSLPALAKSGDIDASAATSLSLPEKMKKNLRR